MINVQVDMVEFQKAFRDYMKFTRKTAAQVINTKMVYIISGAIKSTKKASAQGIRAHLNAGSPPLKENIVAKKAFEHGEFISQTEIKKRAKRLLGASIRSIGFVLSGWLAPLRKMLPYSDRKSIIAPRQRGKDKGGCKPAPLTSGNYATSEAWNSVIGNPPSARIPGIKLEGVSKAFQKEIASMVSYCEKKWQQGGKQYFK